MSLFNFISSSDVMLFFILLPEFIRLTICVNLTKTAPSPLSIEVVLILVSSSRYHPKGNTLSLKIKRFSFRGTGNGPGYKEPFGC